VKQKQKVEKIAEIMQLKIQIFVQNIKITIQMQKLKKKKKYL